MISFCEWLPQMHSSLHQCSPGPVSGRHMLGKAATPRKMHPTLPSGGKEEVDHLMLLYKCCPQSDRNPSVPLPPVPGIP